MKAILKPEDEVKVTPGPEAVRDLEALTSPQELGFFPIDEVEVPSLNDRQSPEHYTRLLVAQDMHRTLDGANACTPVGAIEVVKGDHSFLPSAPLLFEILYYISTTPQSSTRRAMQRTVILSNMYSGMERCLHTNTLVDWENHQVLHYPTEKPRSLGPTPYLNPTKGKPLSSGMMYPDAKSVGVAKALLAATIGKWSVEDMEQMLGVNYLQVYWPSVPKSSTTVSISRHDDTAIINLATHQDTIGYAWEVRQK